MNRMRAAAVAERHRWSEFRLHITFAASIAAITASLSHEGDAVANIGG
jgi:hypothetical protein